MLSFPGHAQDLSDNPIVSFFTGQFATENIVGEPALADCTLSGGTKTTCFVVTARPEPTDYVAGPWCPRNVDDGPNRSGIWFKDGVVYDADGAFMENLPEFYHDDHWHMVDPETGAINVTETSAQCAAAARPDVGEEYENYCVECQTGFVEENLEVTYVIPLDPVMADSPAPLGRAAGAGLALNGIRLDGPAPVDAILGAYTIAPFDDCGGHVNLNVGYHYHAATKCLSQHNLDGADAPLIGVAMDGHAILTRDTFEAVVPGDLDRCGGHVSEGLGYHYHAGPEGSNAILGCMAGEFGCVLTEEGATCDATRRGPRP